MSKRKLLVSMVLCGLAGCAGAGNPEIAPDGHRVVFRRPPGASPTKPKAAVRQHMTEQGKLLPERHAVAASTGKCGCESDEAP